MIVQPAKELYAAIAKSFPAFPCWAMGYPSKDVATVPGSPGALNKKEDVDWDTNFVFVVGNYNTKSGDWNILGQAFMNWQTKPGVE